MYLSWDSFRWCHIKASIQSAQAGRGKSAADTLERINDCVPVSEFVIREEASMHIVMRYNRVALRSSNNRAVKI